jgi:hypothetical protein
MDSISFSDIAIVACGTMRMELQQLKAEGFLDTEHLYFTTPGLHQDIHELERQLVETIKKAQEKVDKIIVVYGGKFCYVNPDDPLRNMQTLIEEQGPNVRRIEATHCMNMIATDEEQKEIANNLAGDDNVWWMTPGWVKFRPLVFKGWDKAIANENFPRHSGGAIVLDGIGYLDQYMAEKPEEFLEYCDWMGIPMQGYATSLARLKSLLIDQAKKFIP